MGRTPNKMWVDKGSNFYKRSIKLWLQDIDIEIYSTHNEGKSLVTKIIVRTLKEKNPQIYDFHVKKCAY